ncbi:hypothetical protein MGG_10610 [Pyricularia oryzae 70-15]|uniref:Enoyl reductase (ER) domain-containing protein n=1 Tax=Pyricularia oryzae (strain 70-15 / ATCC MYA-4617 / FGSC 8958) TaxID=242507 RepID=G4MQ08_PYRO7|nr:uncharacterized protein MGG_10610 [Pyricularia oryzae 70-15]EHA58096.1 hypothetical protein MGG_10610 [Pyricularia oryzae 70-15]
MELLYHTNPQAKAWKWTSCWEHIVLLPDVGLIKLARRLHTPRFWEESFSPTVESSSSRSKITTGWHAKEAQFLKTLGIAKDHIFSSRDAGFERLVADKTTGHGVDVVLNSLSGDLEESIDSKV